MIGSAPVDPPHLLVAPNEVAGSVLELAFAVAQCPPDCIAVMRPKGSAFGLPVIGRCAAKYAELYPDNGPFEVRYMPRELFHCYHCGSDHE